MAAPVLETARLLLRPWRESDYEPWMAMHEDPQVVKTLGGVLSRDASLAMAQRLAQRLLDDGYGWWVIELKGGAPFAGSIELQDVPFEAPFTPAVEVGWRLPAAFWGHGYATEGARAALDLGFGKLGLDEIIAITAKINTPSQRVMNRLGMTYDPAADFRHPKLPLDHALSPSVLYRLRRA